MLKTDDRITVYGDLEVVAVQGGRVPVRVVSASTPRMFAVIQQEQEHQPIVRHKIDD